jgi:hypothetical protein
MYRDFSDTVAEGGGAFVILGTMPPLSYMLNISPPPTLGLCIAMVQTPP